jgi:hypothetical protein
MSKRFLPVILIAAFTFSCNNNSNKTATDKTDITDSSVMHEVVKIDKAERNDQLLYLDTAENMYNILCQGWVNADDADALTGMQEDSKFEIAYRSYYFAANGTYVQNPRNSMDHGRWEYDDKNKTIIIHFSDGKGKDVYKIVSLASDELKLRNMGLNTVTNLEFISDGKRFRDPAKEPFALENNRWRIPPARKETDAEIHHRLKESLRFFILFYKSAIIKKDKDVSFWGLPTCFKWYGGGIYIKKKEELKENWIECFYNKEQAMKAYKLADKLIEQKYEWPKNGNWLEKNLGILEQMYKKLDEIK